MQDSSPRIVRLGRNPGCPCGGTHVADIADIGGFKVLIAVPFCRVIFQNICAFVTSSCF